LQVTARAALRLLITSFFGNFAGCGIMVGLFSITGHYNGASGAYARYLAEDKVRGGSG
jgi:formate/nitrite transporter FocA (FNT family)